MAKVKTIFGALRADLLPAYGETVAPEATRITISDAEGNTYIFFGDFTYDQFGPHGTVTSIEYLIDGKVNFRVNELSVPVEPLFAPETTIYDAIQLVLANDDLVYGRDADDTLAGGAGADRIYGKGGGDVIFGEAGNDVLSGDDGSDVLVGGQGADRLRGGAGADLFAFQFATESTVATDGRDRILDFNSAEFDVIDLRAIDGDFASPLTVVDAFSNTAGELLIREKGDNQFVVFGDLDGNGAADFAITVVTVAGSAPLSGSDFLL